MNVSGITGDICRVRADAMILAINGGGMWYGGVDRAMYGTPGVGQSFHQQLGGELAASGELKSGFVFVAKGVPGVPEQCFQNVVFVIDNLNCPLGELIEVALKQADEAGFKKVTMPAIRMGVMAGAVEKTAPETMAQYEVGIQRYLESRSDGAGIEELTIVVYNDQETQQRFEELGRKRLAVDAGGGEQQLQGSPPPRKG